MGGLLLQLPDNQRENFVFSDYVICDDSEVTNYLSGLKGNSQVLWYPAAGNDYRDLLYTHPESLKRYGLKDFEEPEFFIHTDYHPRDISDKAPGDYLFKNKVTEVILESARPFRLTDISYCPNTNHANSFLRNNRTPRGYLLDLTIKTDCFEPFRRRVIYLYLENTNFLEEFALKRRMNITHLYKFREGWTDKSISYVYMLLGFLDTRYLFVDNSVHYDGPEELSSLAASAFKDGTNRIATLNLRYSLEKFQNYQLNILSVQYRDECDENMEVEVSRRMKKAAEIIKTISNVPDLAEKYKV